MGCGASTPSDERLDGAGMLPAQGKQQSALAQKVTITSKPTKAVAPHKRQSTITASTSSISNNDQTADKKRGKKEHGIVPVTAAPSSPPPPQPQPQPAASIAVPPSPRSDRSRDITPRSPRTPRSAQQPSELASTPTQLRSLQSQQPPPLAEQRASASRISVIDAAADINGGGGLAALDRPRGGSHALPPLKVKGRPGTAPAAAVPDELTATEPIGKKKKSKRNKDDQQPSTPSTQLSPSQPADEVRTPKPRVQRSASSADLALPMTPQARARQSVVLAPLPARSKTTMQRASVMVPPTSTTTTTTSTSTAAPAAAHTAKSPSISTPAQPTASSSSSSPQFLASDHQKQVDAHPSLWSSPTLLAAYPEAVFNHYAVMSHAPPTHTELMFISKKGVSRLGRDSVDEWMRVWRNRLNTGGDAGETGGSGKKAEKEKKRAKGKMDTDGLFVLSRLLQMNIKNKKDVFRDDLDLWVVRRIRQELQADSEGRISKANFINGWKSCHSGIYNTGNDEQGKPTDENPMACVVM